jgi:hypothetical protein
MPDLINLPDPQREPPVQQKRPGVNYDVDALRRAVAAGQLPKEVLAEVEKDPQNA